MRAVGGTPTQRDKTRRAIATNTIRRPNIEEERVSNYHRPLIRVV